MYILKLKPVFKDYIWGGTKLRDEYSLTLQNLQKVGCCPVTKMVKT